MIEAPCQKLTKTSFFLVFLYAYCIFLVEMFVSTEDTPLLRPLGCALQNQVDDRVAPGRLGN
jgi:hypothetical protein